MGFLCRIVGTWALAVVVAVLVVLLVAGDLLSWSPVVIAGQLLAVAGMVWARRSFPAATFGVTAAPRGTAVIEKGPYRWVRHPQYAGMLVLVWAGVLAHRSPLSLAAVGVLLVVVALRVPCEERALRERLPGYADYASRTKRLIPFVI